MWIVLVLIMLALIGSIFWLKPSPRDQRLADLRLQAMKLGLSVKHQTFNPESAKNGVRDTLSGTTYSLFVEDAKAPKDIIFRVVRQSGWDNEDLPDEYSWHDKVSQKNHDWFCALQFDELIGGCNDSLKLIEVCGNRVTIMANEDPQASAEQYKVLLDTLLSKIPHH